MRPETRVVFVESPGSITFEVQDVPAIAEVAHARGALVVMDNTWATPYFFAAMQLGVDVSIIAATKYIGGHADVMLGTITTTEPLYEPRTVNGGRAWLLREPRRRVSRAARPAHVRLATRAPPAEHVAGGGVAGDTAGGEASRLSRVAERSGPRDLEAGLHAARAACSASCLKPVPKAAVDAMLNSLRLFGMGASFGGFESLADPNGLDAPATAHAGRRDKRYLRLHVGLEDPADLIADLEYGLRPAATSVAAESR